jgi:hypothetical protein
MSFGSTGIVLSDFVFGVIQRGLASAPSGPTSPTARSATPLPIAHLLWSPVSKLTKQQAALHAQACAYLEKDVLTLDERILPP